MEEAIPAVKTEWDRHTAAVTMKFGLERFVFSEAPDGRPGSIQWRQGRPEAVQRSSEDIDDEGDLVTHAGAKALWGPPQRS